MKKRSRGLKAAALASALPSLSARSPAFPFQQTTATTI